MNLRLIGNVVLVVLPDTDAERRSTSGLFLAESLPPVTTFGRVAKVGPQVADVAVGDAVAFPPEVGDPVFLGGHDCLFMRESEIAAVIAKREAAV